MSIPTHLSSVVRRLPESRQSEHFRVHYGPRNPRSGVGLAGSGVKDRTIVDTYLDALEQLYRAFLAPPWCRRPPIVDPISGRTHVYVFDMADSSPYLTTNSPFMAIDRNNVPFIGLPSCNYEPTNEAELLRAAAEAVHEGCHVFNSREKPLTDPMVFKPWAWFDEGTAIYMEMSLLPRNPDYLRFIGTWVNNPEIPIDDDGAWYQSGMFVHYLAKKLGVRWLSQVWSSSSRTETPFDAMNRLLVGQNPLISSDPTVQDFFASGYCLDAYFCNYGAGCCFPPGVRSRHGERALTESLDIAAGSHQLVQDALDHLSCRYYRFHPGRNVAHVQFLLEAGDPKRADGLRGLVVEVNAAGERGATHMLSGSVQCDIAVNGPASGFQVDHYLIIVTNCGTRLKKVDPAVPHDDEVGFKLSVGAN